MTNFIVMRVNRNKACINFVRMSTSFFIILKLYLRSEFENLRTHYLMAKEKNDQLGKELKLMRDTKAGFFSITITLFKKNSF